MPRLRRSKPTGPGIARKRTGHGFRYVDQHGDPIKDPATKTRIAALVIPPAWEDVWICPWPNGHIQATGVDAAGRRQYVYHPEWRIRRDAVKHDHVLELGRLLPAARERIDEDLATRGLNRRRVLAAAARMLDLGFFRVGGERYAEDNGSFGLATIEKSHVHVTKDEVVFDYPAKSGQERLIAVADADVIAAVTMLRSRRTGGKELLAFRDGNRWRDLTSTDVNKYVKGVVGGDVSAKDFRTWHGTVLAAVALAKKADDFSSATRRKKAVRAAMGEVSQYLGNTPTVARGSYVDPRVIDAYESGMTIAPTLRRLGARAEQLDESRDAIERAVLRMLR